MSALYTICVSPVHHKQALLSGSARELGRQMKLGIETAFNRVNESGGVDGRMLKLYAADDGYEPTRTPDAMKQLYEKDQVFGIIGNVGTPTATVAIPYSLERRMLFFGAFTGANVLRNDPPDRYVFNYRASYVEETDADQVVDGPCEFVRRYAEPIACLIVREHDSAVVGYDPVSISTARSNL